jgi:hypothetical protein
MNNQQFFSTIYKSLIKDKYNSSPDRAPLYRNIPLPTAFPDPNSLPIFNLLTQAVDVRKIGHITGLNNWELLDLLTPPGYRFGSFTVSNKDIIYLGNIKDVLHSLEIFLKFYYSGIKVDSVLKALTHENGIPFRIPPDAVFIKYSGLFGEYVIKGKFDTPCTANFIEQFNKWFLHPGGSRATLSGLFPNTRLKVLGLGDMSNLPTNFKEINSQKQLTRYFSLEEDVEYHLSWIGFGNKLYPQVSFNYVNYHSNFKNIFKAIYNFFNEYSIESNFNFSHFPNTSSQIKGKIFIELDHPDSPVDICRALLFVPFFQRAQKSKINLQGIKYLDISV